MTRLQELGKGRSLGLIISVVETASKFPEFQLDFDRLHGTVCYSTGGTDIVTSIIATKWEWFVR